MARFFEYFCFSLIMVFAFGWLRFYREQPTWWDLIAYFGS